MRRIMVTIIIIVTIIYIIYINIKKKYLKDNPLKIKLNKSKDSFTTAKTKSKLEIKKINSIFKIDTNFIQSLNNKIGNYIIKFQDLINKTKNDSLAYAKQNQQKIIKRNIILSSVASLSLK